MLAGIDIGSTSTKAVLVNERESMAAFSLVPTLFDRNKSGLDALSVAIEKAGISRGDITYIVTTGYGRRSLVGSHKALPEIICHAKGTKFLHPATRTIIDIGGQDSKIIELDEVGNIIKFQMNDKCAAGTGRFLEVLAERILHLSLDELGALSLEGKDPCVLSSICTVFAESEIISYLSENRDKEEIVLGMNRAIAKRVIALGTGGMMDYKEPIVFSGGVAKNVGVVRAIEGELKKKVTTPEYPQLTAAFGAALFAREYSS